jgi:hypothetical protein
VKTGVDRDATPRPAGAQAGAAAAPPAAGASPGPPSRRPRFLRRTLQRAIDRGWFAESRLLEFYPPFLWMRIRVMEIADGWRRVRIRCR